MKRLAAAAVIALLAIPDAQAVQVVKRDRLPPDAIKGLACTIEVEFGSHSTGPDMDAWIRIRDYLANSMIIDEAEAWGWGREGEFTVCLKVQDAKDTQAVFSELTQLVPAPGDGRTLVRLTTTKK